MEKLVNDSQVGITKETSLRLDVIDPAVIKLEKAEFLLSSWIQKYGYSEKPDPQAALNWRKDGSKDGLEGVSRKQSFDWYWEYETIYNMVDIAFDYIEAAKKVLQDGLKK